MHSLKELIKEYWNIYGSVILSTILSWLLNWNAEQMFALNQYIGVTISIMCFLTMIKFLITPKGKKTLIETVVSTQPSVKKTDILLHQDEKNEKLYKEGKRIMNRIKKVLSWIKNYWQQIIGLLGTFALATLAVFFVITDKFGWLLQYFPETPGWQIGVRIAFGVVAVLFTFYMVRNQVKWCGVGSIAHAQEYLKQFGIKAASSISKENRTMFKEALNTAKKALKTAKASLEASQIKYDNAVKEFDSQNEFVKTLTTIGAESVILGNAKTRLAELQQSVVILSNELNAAKAIVAKHEKEIADYEKALSL